MSGEIAGVDATGSSSFAAGLYGADFGLGGHGAAPVEGEGGLAAQIDQLIGLLQQLLETLGGEEAASPVSEEGGGEQAEQPNTQVLQAIQLLLEFLLGGQGEAASGIGPELTSEV